ncbi:MAG: sigma 54-interacting transcriptional regulator, partial [Myxococcales bacterium]|nr:sigma 54-interacting transcriptional regulator [Myxococcales bacterium]
LAEGRWDDADRHFAEDALVASAAGDRTGELRARLNRGIALLSKGLVDDARAILKDVLKDAEAAGDARAQAITLHNLSVIAMGRREYMSALGLLERTVSLRQRLGDRVRLAQILANLAELRLKLGLVDHADHAIAFGRRLLGPGMPPGRAAEFGAAAARVLLARQHSVDARREIATAIVDAEASGDRELLAEAHGIAARVALDDGDVTRATDAIARAQELATKPELVAELAILACQNARAQGAGDVDAGRAALGLAQATGDAELTCEAHAVLAALHADARDLETARAHHARAVGLRDQIAQGLDGEVRSAFLARRDMAQLGRMASQLVDREDEGPRTQRSPSSVPPSSQPRFREMVGEDPAIRSLVASIKKVARSNSTVLVHGESGTGKELVAEALHRASDRADGPFVAVNCAALVETLLLSELFGHEKGAFTGASARRRGRFEMAEGGTLFLDEIGDISPRTQVALLRVLQEKTFERVGGVAPIRANVRVVCATHRDLKAMVERGEFREDLYYRLRGITLEVPPLRSRPGDLPKIAEHLLARIADERAEAPKALAPDAIDLLVRHRWQGNVRELENVLRAVALFADDQVILASDLIENVDDFRELARSSAAMGGPPSVPPPPSSPLAARMYADSLPSIPAPPASLPEISGDDEDGAPLPEDEANATAVAYAQVRQGAVSLADMKRQIERDCIARALAETKGNITKAAALLGMKRPRLSQLVKQYGLTAVSTEGP